MFSGSACNYNFIQCYSLFFLSSIQFYHYSYSNSVLEFFQLHAAVIWSALPDDVVSESTSFSINGNLLRSSNLSLVDLAVQS